MESTPNIQAIAGGLKTGVIIMILWQTGEEMKLSRPGSENKHKHLRALDNEITTLCIEEGNKSISQPIHRYY